MKCPECVAEGERSKVYPHESHRTLLAVQRYFDEDGTYHSHDPNKTTTKYECSRGHKWSEAEVRETTMYHCCKESA